MGWNTWNTFGEEINEKLIIESANAFVALGLLEAGYQYLVIDDCWSEKERDPVTGKIMADRVKFPNGMKYIADYLHSRGMKFGMYSCCGVRTCADYPGSFDHEFLDAETFAEYGCDYLKYDFCYRPENADGQLLYRRMGMALDACKRDIVLSACNWGLFESEKWMRSTGASLYRSTGDIFDNFESFKQIAMSQLDKLYASGSGCYNDMDMLTVGMYGKGNTGSTGCCDNEYRTQFALWCMCGSPLMLGCDIRNITPQTLELITNKTLIRINQDIEARPPIVATQSHPRASDRLIMLRHLSDGEYAIGLFNMGDDDSTLTLLFDEMGLPAASGYAFALTDAFTGEALGVKKEYLHQFLPAHACAVFLGKLIKA